MELISIGYLQSIVTKQYGKHLSLKGKISTYFSRFVYNYTDYDYVWFEDRLYIEAKHGPQIKADIEALLHKTVVDFNPKEFPPDFDIRFISASTAQKKIERKIEKKKRELAERRRIIKNKFLRTIKKIKSGDVEFNIIGCLDLEFWEKDMGIILEFGWRIEDYSTGKGETVHLIVQENLKYENGFYSENNRFARSDSQVVSLNTAKSIFKTEFLDKVQVIVGHGLSNDIKVLETNGMDIKIKHLDTTSIGAAMMEMNDSISLTKLLTHLKIEHSGLHNAANDVEYIMQAFYELGDL